MMENVSECCGFRSDISAKRNPGIHEIALPAHWFFQRDNSAAVFFSPEDSVSSRVEIFSSVNAAHCNFFSGVGCSVHSTRRVGFQSELCIRNLFFNLPIEEVLFFFCIPYSCVFSYFCLGKIFPQLLAARLNSFFIQAIAIVLLIISIFNFGKLYTALAFSLDGIFLLIAARMIPQKMFLFFISYLLMLIPFLIVNGILTGTGIENEVVWYSNNENLGIRLLTIPVEDFFMECFW